MTETDGAKLRKSFFPALVSELFWTLNNVLRCSPEVALGWLQSCRLGGLPGPGASSLSVGSGPRVLGAWVLQLARLLAYSWAPGMVPQRSSCLFESSESTDASQGLQELSAPRPLGTAL